VFEYYDPNRGVSLNGRSRIITLELSKLEKVVEKPAIEMSASEYWAVYFGYLTEKEKRRKINEILDREEGIAMASKVLMSISRDEIERARLMSEYKGQLDTQSKLVYAKRMGIQEGRAQGMTEGLQRGHAEGMEKEKLEIARKMKEMGEPFEKIQTITGLPTESIEQM
jgi:predicted transposase/invertase (TIGR01784 family)